MAYRHRRAAAQQTDLITGDSSFGSSFASFPGEIAAPTGKPSTDGGDGTIVAASQPTVVLSSIQVPVTVTQDKTVMATPTQTATTSPTATPAPAHSGLGTGAIVGIVVAVVAVLMIPAAYLIWRSHQMKKEEEGRASQRSSQEAMIVRETAEPRRDNGPPPPRPRREPTEAPRERPTNSLGLFNFDLGSPSPGPVSPPKSPEVSQKSGPRLSIARTLQLRRSEVNVVNQERRSQQQMADLRNGLRNNPPTNRNSRESPDRASPPPPDAKFAPLNNIGTAVSVGRPKFNRNGSSSTIPREFSPPPPQEMPRPRTATGPPRQSPSQNDMSRPRTAASPQQSPPQKDMSRPYMAYQPRPPPPGTQDMRPSAGLLTAENLPSSRITNPPISAYSMSNYHDSLRPEPKDESKAEPQSDQPTLQPPEAAVIGRAVSPVHRSISPINNYQLPTFGLGGNDRFSWGVGNTMTHNEEAELRKKKDLSRKNSTQNHERAYSNNNRIDPAERQSQVSNLSYNPADDYRKSNGRAVSPIESEDEDYGMRTREYR